MVEYRPVSAKDQSRLHQPGSIVLPGLFLEELEEMDASEIQARRLNAKEVLAPQRSGNFIFLVSDGTVKPLVENFV